MLQAVPSDLWSQASGTGGREGREARAGRGTLACTVDVAQPAALGTWLCPRGGGGG